MVSSLPLHSLFLGFGGSLVGPGHVHGPGLDFQFCKILKGPKLSVFCVLSWSMFASVVVVISQIDFYLKIYQNNIFLLFKNYF